MNGYKRLIIMAPEINMKHEKPKWVGALDLETNQRMELRAQS